MYICPCQVILGWKKTAGFMLDTLIHAHTQIYTYRKNVKYCRAGTCSSIGLNNKVLQSSAHIPVSPELSEEHPGVKISKILIRLNIHHICLGSYNPQRPYCIRGGFLEYCGSQDGALACPMKLVCGNCACQWFR